MRKELAYSESETVLALSDPKHAALYFRTVCPLKMEGIDHATKQELTAGAQPAFDRAFFGMLADMTRERGRPPELPDLTSFVEDHGAAIWGESRLSPLIRPASSPRSAGLVLANARLVDASQASWDQILELRRDAESRESFSALRRFSCDSYAGREQAYVRDDLAERIADYERKAKKHGFKLAEANFYAFSASAGNIAAQIFGQVDMTVANVGMLVGFGAATLQLAWRDQERVEQLVPHEARYLVEARKRLQR